ncbi:MAG: c-type cytochrome [Saprospiraceae bacterium]|nr:c-type cytochrome [Saprospiraceae bacterium]
MMVVDTCKWVVSIGVVICTACGGQQTSGKVVGHDPIQLDDQSVQATAQKIRGQVSPEVDSTLHLSLWAIDTLLADPVALDMDDRGNALVTRTNRRRSTEFDIRNHPEWEVASQSFTSVEDRRNFLKQTLTKESSGQYEKPPDFNKDGFQTWEDLLVESEEVYRIADKSGDGYADYAELVATGFSSEVTDIAGGVMADGSDVYLSVAPDLWRLRDLDGDGYAEDRTSLMTGFQVHIGFGGHNMSGVKMGPDGRIYWAIGDIGFNGVDQNGKRWYYPNQGVVCRANPDGSEFEVFAAGLRNTHEFTFDAYGNLISVDNDGDHPGESERLVYLVDGSDSGWRINWQFGKYRDPDNNEYKVWMDERMDQPRHDDQAAFITPCIHNYIDGPTGMAYNPGTGLGEEWVDRFFVVEFNGNPARSGIHSFSLQPKGASFEFVEGRKILGGVLATGLDFGTNGELFFTDWIDGWAKKGYGRIWNLRAKIPTLRDIQLETALLLESGFSKKSISDLTQLLAHADMRVRQKVQFELVNRGDVGADALRGAIQPDQKQIKRIHAIWGLGQLLRQDVGFASDLVPLLDDNDAEIRAQVLEVLGDAHYTDAGDQVIELLRDNYPRVRFFAAQALGRMGVRRSVPAIIEMLKANNDEDAYLRHAGSLALARIGDRSAVSALAHDASDAVRMAAVIALRRMKDPSIDAFLEDKSEHIVTEAARAINDDLSIDAALPSLGNLLNQTPHTNEPLVRRCINANQLVGTEQAVQNLVKYMQNTAAPGNMRAEAIAALGVWPKPSVFDRVDGRYRGEVIRDATPVISLAVPILEKMLFDGDPIVREQSIIALSKLQVKTAERALKEVFKNDAKPVLRGMALETLANMDVADMTTLLNEALQDPSKEVKVAAIQLVDRIDAEAKELVSLLEGVLTSGEAEEQQAAIRALASLPAASTKALVEKLMRKMSQNSVDPVIHLDLIQLAETQNDPSMNALVSAYRASLNVEGDLVNYMECLEGGDAAKGRRIFIRNANAQCLKCHKVRGYGGEAGPALDGVGDRLSREKLLQSIVDPSAEVAAGFGVVTLILKDDKTISGISVSENDAKIVVRGSDEQEITVSKADIKERIDAMSSMPAMGPILNKVQIRDLVAFLVTMRGHAEGESHPL